MNTLPRGYTVRTLNYPESSPVVVKYKGATIGTSKTAIKAYALIYTHKANKEG